MLVLDTHVLVWWVNGEGVSKKAEKAIENSQSLNERIIISSISSWEIAMLIQKGRLVLSMDIGSWIKQIEKIQNLEFYPVDNEIAINSACLPGDFHKDPADRIIVATARKLSANLITADSKILEYKHVKTIW